MLTFDSYTSGDTYARHVIVRLGRLKVDLAIVALDDEGMDQRLARAVLSWGDWNRLIEAGVDRDHTINYDTGAVTTTRWHPTGRTYAWSWAGREGAPL